MEPRRADEAVPEEDDRTRKERLKNFAQDKTPKKLKNPTNFQVRFRTGFVYIVVSVAVSYTHLDVYKSQVRATPVSLGPRVETARCARASLSVRPPEKQPNA